MRRWTAGLTGLLLVTVAVGLSLQERSGPSGPMSEEQFCRELRSMEVSHALAGDEPAAQLSAIAILAEVDGRAPAEIRSSVELIAERARSTPNLLDLASRALDHPDHAAAAHQVTYGLGFDHGYQVSAGRIERYAVERCGMESSGRWDHLDLDAELDDSLFPGLDPSYEPPVAEFDESQFERFELAPSEAPPVTFDESDWDRFTIGGRG